MFLKYFSSIFLGAQGCIAGHLPLAGNKNRWFLKYISESRVKKGKTTNNSDTVREYVKYNDGLNYWKTSFFLVIAENWKIDHAKFQRWCRAWKFLPTSDRDGSYSVSFHALLQKSPWYPGYMWNSLSTLLLKHST